MNRRDFRKQLDDYLPAGGGDSIACSVQFLHRGQSYLLAKRWGRGGPRSWCSPTARACGARSRSAPRWPTSCRPAKGPCARCSWPPSPPCPARSRSWIRGGAFPGDFLRRAVLQPDGMSVSVFQERLEERRLQALRRWDLDRGQPEANRGADRPWQDAGGGEELVRAGGTGTQARRSRAGGSPPRELSGPCSPARGDGGPGPPPPGTQAGRPVGLEAPLPDRRAGSAPAQPGGLQKAYDLWPRLEHSLSAAERELPAAGERSRAGKEKSRARKRSGAGRRGSSWARSAN